MDREHSSIIVLLLAVILVVLVGIWIELLPADRALDSSDELPGWAFFLCMFGVVMLLGGAGAMVVYARDEIIPLKNADLPWLYRITLLATQVAWFGGFAVGMLLYWLLGDQFYRDHLETPFAIALGIGVLLLVSTGLIFLLEKFRAWWRFMQR
jgi:hypothetical protein